MGIDMQLAGIWKRMAAWLLDIILIAVLAVGFAYIFSMLFQYDAASDALSAHYDRYAAEYGQELLEKDPATMSEEELAVFEQMNRVMNSDEQLLRAYDKVINLTLLMISLSILSAVLILEFLVPLLLKNGQTIGKKCFSIGIVRNDSVRMNHLQLFTRAILGKYTIDLMLPVYVVLLVVFGGLGIFGTIILGCMAIGQILCIGLNRNNCALHDLMAGTVVVDLPSQQVFESTEELIEYKNRIHEELAKKQDY